MAVAVGSAPPGGPGLQRTKPFAVSTTTAAIGFADGYEGTELGLTLEISTVHMRVGRMISVRAVVADAGAGKLTIVGEGGVPIDNGVASTLTLDGASITFEVRPGPRLRSLS